MSKLVEKMRDAMQEAARSPGGQYEDLARAALAVVMAEMREPTDAMLDAPARRPYSTQPGHIWDAMFAQFEKENQ